MFLHPTYAPDGTEVYTNAPPLPAHYAPAPAAPACGCQHHGFAPLHTSGPVAAQRPSLAPYVAAGIGAAGAVVVVGMVLVGLMLAFAVSALAIAVVIAVLRGLLNSPQYRGR